MTYRTGRHLGRTIYRVGHDGYEALIGIMDTPEDGALVAEALNARERVLAARGTSKGSPQRDMSVPQMCQDSEGRTVASDQCELNVPHYVTTLGTPHGLVRQVPTAYPHHHNAACLSDGCTLQTADGRVRGDLPEVPPSEGAPLPDLRTCGRVGMHNCSITGRWQSHDSNQSLPEPPPVSLEVTGWPERGGSRTVASGSVPVRPEEPPDEPPTGSYP